MSARRISGFMPEARIFCASEDDAMPVRLVLIIGAVLIVVLAVSIPVAFLIGSRMATSRQAVEPAQPDPSAPPAPDEQPAAAPPPAAAPAAAAVDEPPKPASEPEAPANAARSHAKGGVLGGLVAAVGDDAAAEGKHIADDLDAQAHAAVAKARTDAMAALNRSIDRAATSVDAAADQLERKAQQAADAGARATLHEAQDAARSVADDPGVRAFLEGVTRQEAAAAAAMSALSATMRTDIAAAAKEASARVHAYGESIRKMANPATLPHGADAPDEAAMARDIDKQAAQALAALESFTAATDAIQKRCDDAIAHLRQGMGDERAKLTAQLSQAAASYGKQIASLREHLSADIAQALATAVGPLDDAQAKPKATRPGR
jgi:hypothetical protein